MLQRHDPEDILYFCFVVKRRTTYSPFPTLMQPIEVPFFYTFLHHEAAAEAEVVEEERYQMFDYRPVIERRDDKYGAVLFEC